MMKEAEVARLSSPTTVISQWELDWSSSYLVFRIKNLNKLCLEQFQVYRVARSSEQRGEA